MFLLSAHQTRATSQLRNYSIISLVSYHTFPSIRTPGQTAATCAMTERPDVLILLILRFPRRNHTRTIHYKAGYLTLDAVRAEEKPGRLLQQLQDIKKKYQLDLEPLTLEIVTAWTTIGGAQ